MTSIERTAYPRIADIADSRTWRIDMAASYGPLDQLARHRVRLDRIRGHWPDMLRVAGSLITGQVRAYDLIRMISRDGRPTGLGDAFAHYGRISRHSTSCRCCTTRDSERGSYPDGRPRLFSAGTSLRRPPPEGPHPPPPRPPPRSRPASTASSPPHCLSPPRLPPAPPRATPPPPQQLPHPLPRASAG